MKNNHVHPVDPVKKYLNVTKYQGQPVGSEGRGLVKPQPFFLQARDGGEFLGRLTLKTWVPHSGQGSSKGSSQVAKRHFGYWLQA